MFAPAVMTAGVCVVALASVPALVQALSGGAAEEVMALRAEAEAND